MAATRITALPAATTLDYNNDVFPIVDVSATTPITPTGTTSKATISQIASAIYSVNPSIITGTFADPNGYVTAIPGSIYFDLTTPTAPVQWIKTTGTGNTGWI